MPANRIQALLGCNESATEGSSGAACGFVPLPAALLGALPVPQQQFIQEVYRIARERSNTQPRRVVRLAEFSLN